MLWSVRNGSMHGSRLAIVSITGNVLAFQLVLLVCAISLCSIAVTSEWVFYCIRLAGAAYLMYFGLRLCLKHALKRRPVNKTQDARSLFFDGFLSTLTNPKSVIYAAVMLPHIIDTERPWAPQLTSVAITLAALHFTIFATYAANPHRLGNWLAAPATRMVINRLSGAVLIAMGAGLGIAES